MLQGGGVLKADKVKMNQVRHAADKVQGMISGNRSMRDSGWQMSNRCAGSVAVWPLLLLQF